MSQAAVKGRLSMMKSPFQKYKLFGIPTSSSHFLRKCFASPRKLSLLIKCLDVQPKSKNGSIISYAVSRLDIFL